MNEYKIITGRKDEVERELTRLKKDIVSISGFTGTQGFYSVLVLLYFKD